MANHLAGGLLPADVVHGATGSIVEDLVCGCVLVVQSTLLVLLCQVARCVGGLGGVIRRRRRINKKQNEEITVRIKWVVAAAPTQFRVERGDKIEDNPGDYDHVINGDICYYQQCTVAEP